MQVYFSCTDFLFIYVHFGVHFGVCMCVCACVCVWGGGGSVYVCMFT